MSKRRHKSTTISVLRGKGKRGGKDPGNFHRCRRLLKPWRRATGPGSYDEWKLYEWAERRAKAQR